jgi:hypothetical protein
VASRKKSAAKSLEPPATKIPKGPLQTLALGPMEIVWMMLTTRILMLLIQLR